MFDKKYNYDILKLLIYASFVLAVVFYVLSGKLKSNFMSLYCIGVGFLILGIVLIVIKIYSIFKISYNIYKSNIKEKRTQLYADGYDLLDIQKLIKKYKKVDLRVYRLTNIKYILLMAILSFVAIYLTVLLIDLIF